MSIPCPHYKLHNLWSLYILTTILPTPKTPIKKKKKLIPKVIYFQPINNIQYSKQFQNEFLSLVLATHVYITHLLSISQKIIKPGLCDFTANILRCELFWSGAFIRFTLPAATLRFLIQIQITSPILTWKGISVTKLKCSKLHSWSQTQCCPPARRLPAYLVLVLQVAFRYQR